MAYIFKCSRVKQMVVETIDDTVIITRAGTDCWKVKFADSYHEEELYSSDELDALFKE